MGYNLSVVNICHDDFKAILDMLAEYYGCGSNNLSIKLENESKEIFWGCHSWWKPEDYEFFSKAPMPVGFEDFQVARDNLIEVIGVEGEAPINTWNNALESLNLKRFKEEGLEDVI